MSRIQRPFTGLLTPESLQAGNEFTDRDPQYPASRSSTNYSGEGRMASAMESTPLGEPPVDVDVRSTYDVRPIQAYDFNVTVTSGTAGTGEGGALQAFVEFAVPIGYVAVVRAFHHSFSPVFPATVRSDVLMTLLYQEAEVPNNVNIPVGAESQDLVKTFFIADEGSTVGARLDFPNTLVGSYTAFVQIYGNFLRKTGRAANLEVGNVVKSR